MSKSLSGRRLGRIGALLAASAGATSVAGSPASAYCTAGPNRWASSTMHLSAMYTIPSGHHSAINSAANGWDNVSGFNATGVTYYEVGPPGAWSLRFMDTAAAGLGNDPGVTVNGTNDPAASHTFSTVRYNSNWKWNTDGTFGQGEADVRTVLLHEFGHSHGLNHPSACGSVTTAEAAAAMTPSYTKKWSINSDDIAGMNAGGMY